MRIEQNQTLRNSLWNFNEVFQIITMLMILLLKLKTKLYQEVMAITTLIMRYFHSITKKQQFTLIPIAKRYSKHAHFTITAPQDMVDHSVSRNLTAP